MNIQQLEAAIANRLTPHLCDSFTKGFSHLLVPPEEMVKEWIKKDPSRFTSEEEKNRFLEYIEFVNEDESDDDGSDDESDDELEKTVSKYIEQAGIQFVQQVLAQVFPFMLSIDGHPPFWRSDDETDAEKRERIYGVIHEIVYNCFLAIYTDLDSEEVSAVKKEISEAVESGDDHFDAILADLMDENVYAAKAVGAAANRTCAQLVDILIEAAPEVQANLQHMIAARARELGIL